MRKLQADTQQNRDKIREIRENLERQVKSND